MKAARHPRVKLAVIAERGVTVAERRVVNRAIAKLPIADRALIAGAGVQLRLVANTSLEQGMLGATSIDRDSSDRWSPSLVRIATQRAREDGVNSARPAGAESLAEVVQHELGHVVSVLRSQDRSEAAAAAYARRW